MTWWQTTLVSVIVPVFIAVGGWWVSTGKNRTDRENALIDQLQEERRDNGERLSRLEARVDELQALVGRYMSRDTQWSIHADRLEAQLVDANIVPVPRPATLREEV